MRPALYNANKKHLIQKQAHQQIKGKLNAF